MSPVLETLFRRLAVAATALLACAALLTTAILIFPSVRMAVVGSGDGARALLPGQVMKLPGVLDGSRAMTVVLFARSTCGACQMSKPVIQATFNRLRSNQEVDILLVSPDPTAKEEQDYAAEFGLAGKLHGLPDGSSEITRVPTLVALDQRGMILFVKEGLVAQADVDAMEAVLARRRS